MSFTLKSSIIILFAAFQAATALDPKCAPGGNLDLAKWKLQLPTGEPFSPTSVDGSKLASCTGFQEAGTFFSDPKDGALVMKVAGSPKSAHCVTTKNSLHCRTELRESDPLSWNPKATTNRLKATLVVVQADDSARGTVVGQIHIDDKISSKPVCELYYNSKGLITMGVEKTRAGGASIYTEIATVPVGTGFSYEISYEKNVLGVSVNGGAVKTLSTNDLDAPLSYFKAGNYNQGNSPSEVHFFALDVTHAK